MNETVEEMQARINGYVTEIETLKKAVKYARATAEQELLNDMAKRMAREARCPFCGQYDDGEK